jgi:putative peptidoglycan lipid II flippase
VTRRNLARAGMIVSGAFLVSRVLGWVRVAVIATTVGLGGDLDAFYAAFRLPDLMFQLVAAGALASAVIPVVSDLLTHDSEARAWRVVSTVTNLMLGALLVLAVALFVTAPVLVPIITPGFEADQLEQTVELTRIMVLSPVFLALGSMASSVLNARGRFTASVIAPITYNLAMIAGAVLLYPILGIAGLAVGVVAGSVCHLLVQLRPLALEGFAYTPRIAAADPAARQTLRLMAPRAFGLGAVQVTLVVLTMQASTMAEGSVAALNIAFTLLQIPLGVISMSLGVVVLPTLSRELAKGATGEFVYLVSRSLRLLLWVMLPIAGFGMVLRYQVVELLFGYGQFDAAATQMTGDTLLFFLVGLAAHAEIAVLARAFYADKDTRTPVSVAVTGTVLTIVVSVLLSGRMGLPGLALSVALGAWFEALALLFLLARRWPTLDLGALGRDLVVFAGLAVVASLAVLGMANLLEGVSFEPERLALLVGTGLATAVGGAVYVGASRILRIPELATITGVVSDTVRRRG